MDSYLDRIWNRGKGGEQNVPGYLHHKQRARNFVEELGVAVPQELAEYSSVDQINLDALPENFVLKPVFASSNIGVLVLTRLEDGTYFDAMREKAFTAEGILEMQQNALERFKPAEPKWIVEERVLGEFDSAVPNDYKFYAFKGRIGMIHSVERAAPRAKHSYFLGDFTPINDPNDEFVEIVLENLLEKTVAEPPKQATQLIETTQLNSKALPTPFARIDMYAGKNGPVFGEFTLVPGTFYYEDREKMKEPLSNYLGMLWQQAELENGLEK